MASEKQHVRHRILFAFQLKKSAAKAANMISSALGERAVTHKNFENVPANRKSLKTMSLSSCQVKTPISLNRSSLYNLELPSN
jgi:hypothetical protein